MKQRQSIAVLVAIAAIVGACAGTDWDEENQSLPETHSPPVAEHPSATLIPPNSEPYPDVYFDNPGVSPFIDSEDDPLSTFALDVDTGSYTVARRYLADGFLPEPDSVRVEEYVNYFDQGYPMPDPEDGLGLFVDGGVTPFVQSVRSRVIRIGVQAAEPDAWTRPDANLVFVIDTSGSMERENRLELVKEALTMMLRELRPTDTLSVVEYGSHARLVLPPTRIDDGFHIEEAIRSLRPGGSTNAASGLELGYRAAAEGYRPGGINRVILCSDGVANFGEATDAEGILDLIARDALRGIHLVTAGFGMGNYNDVLMEQLADRGNGLYAYIDDLDEAHRLFVQDLSGTLQTVAMDARIQVEFDPLGVQSWRLIGFENRAMSDERFRDDSTDAGEVGAGHTVTALYEVKPTPEAEDGVTGLGAVHLRWIDPETREPREVARPLSMTDLAADFGSTDPHFQLSVVVAQYAEILRESVWADQIGVDMDDIAEHADRVGRLLSENRDVAEFVELVRRAAWLEG
ncbi:MAG TPA: von Willebrand factor type A domain-containing protein [Acidimicrobiia bacterium]